MSLADEIADGLDELRDAIDDTTRTRAKFPDDDHYYPCVASTLKRGTQWQVGGEVVEIQLTLIFALRDLPQRITVDSTLITIDDTSITADQGRGAPTAGEKLTYREREYRVASVDESGAGSHIEVQLTDPHR